MSAARINLPCFVSLFGLYEWRPVMTEESVQSTRLLRAHKSRLLDILCADADFVLQHADSRSLLSPHGYLRVKACRTPTEKVTDLLDHIIQRGPEAARAFVELLRDKALQEAFPRLDFLNDLQEEERWRRSGGATLGERQTELALPDLGDGIPPKVIHNSGSTLVTEKQLMRVARAIGRSWKEIGRMALDVPSVKLERIEEDNSQHVERVFAMLRCWSAQQRKRATAANLHSLLCQGDWNIGDIEFLVGGD